MDEVAYSFYSRRIWLQSRRWYISISNSKFGHLHSGAERHKQDRRSAWTAAQARTHGFWPTAVHPYVTTVYRFNGLHLRNLCKCKDYCVLVYRRRRVGRLSWLLLIRSGQVYPQIDHKSTLDRAQVRESPPTKNRRPNNWVTPRTVAYRSLIPNLGVNYPNWVMWLSDLGNWLFFSISVLTTTYLLSMNSRFLILCMFKRWVFFTY